MSGAVDQLRAALHNGFDQLEAVVAQLSPEQLTGPSAAAEWTIADVLSHLGSGAVIAQATIEHALTGAPKPSNPAIWDRWNALPPPQQSSESITANRELQARYDSVDDAAIESLRVDMGFLPEPVPFDVPLRFRLSELAFHSWDIRVGVQPGAVLEPSAVPLLMSHVEGMFGWIAKPAKLPGRTIAVQLHDPDTAFGLTFGEASAEIGGVPGDPDAHLTLSAEAWLRLVVGRLQDEYLPDGAEFTGTVSFDELRSVFPGF